MVDNYMADVFIATKDATYLKILSNIEEIRVRSKKIIAITNECDS